MDRPRVWLAIAIALCVFGVYRALHVPGMLIGPPALLLLLGVVLQAAFGILAGVGAWRGASWTPVAILLLGVSIAAAALIDVVLGIRAYFYAFVEAAVAMGAAVVLAGAWRWRVPRSARTASPPERDVAPFP